MESNIVIVKLWDTEIGRVYWDGSDPRRPHSVFQLSGEAAKNGWPIAPMEMPYASDPVRASLPASFRDKESSFLPRFISDSLPDEWGNSLIVKWAAKKGIPARHISPVDKLSFIGKRGMGALEYIPQTYQPKGPDSINP